MPSVETSIWMALKARVQSLPTTIVPQSSIAYPRKPFVKPQAGSMLLPFIEVKHLPNRVSRRGVGSDDASIRPGILQLDYMAPIAGPLDDVQITEMAGRIAEHFPVDLPLPLHGVTVRIERAPDVSQGLLDGEYWRVPVSVRYLALH